MQGDLLLTDGMRAVYRNGKIYRVTHENEKVNTLKKEEREVTK